MVTLAMLPGCANPKPARRIPRTATRSLVKNTLESARTSAASRMTSLE